MSKIRNEKGVVPVLVLVAVVALVAFFAIAGLSSFRGGGLLGSLFPKTKTNAAGLVDLSLVPGQATVSPNDTFAVDVVADGKNSTFISGVEATINYDPTVLQVTDIKQGASLQQAADPCTFSLITQACTVPFTDAYTKQAAGKIYFVVGAKSGESLNNGKITVANITFKALTATAANNPSTIKFDSSDCTSSGSAYSCTSVAAIDSTGGLVTGDAKGTLNSSFITVNSGTVAKTANLSLTPATVSSAAEFPIKVMMRSDTDPINLVAAKINFDATKLAVTRIDTTGSFVTNWAENGSDIAGVNLAGRLSLIGGVPTPGIKTTGTDLLMATVYFVPKVVGSTPLAFDGVSAVYRNSDNANILNNKVGSTITMTGVPVSASPSPSVAPSPSAQPSVAPSPSPAPSVGASPSAAASAAPSPSPSPSKLPSASPSAVASASPSPSASPLACTISGAVWGNATNPVNDQNPVTMTITGTGACSGKSVAFDVEQDNGILTPTKSTITPSSVTFNASNVATGTWLAEYHPDGPVLVPGLGGLFDPPEYYFNVTLAGTTTAFRSTNAELKVNKLPPGSFVAGDVNRDGRVDLQDLSVLLSHWQKLGTANQFPAGADMNLDGTINNLDYSALVAVLRASGAFN